MKYFLIADTLIGIQYNGLQVDSYYKTEQFVILDPDCTPAYVVNLTLADELQIPKQVPDDHGDNCSYYLENRTRVFYTFKQPYAVLRECEPGYFALTVLKSRAEFIRNDFLLFNLIGIEAMIMERGGFFLHSSQIMYRNQGVLFSAPSGTGKTTQAELWNRYKGATIVNGDKSVIKQKAGQWYSYGVPYSGSSEYCTTDSCPLRAIVYLSQAPEDRLTRLSPMAAFRKIYSETTVNYWNADYVEQALSMITALVEQIPVYYFECTKEETAVAMLYKELWGEE